MTRVSVKYRRIQTKTLYRSRNYSVKINFLLLTNHEYTNKYELYVILLHSGLEILCIHNDTNSVWILRAFITNIHYAL